MKVVAKDNFDRDTVSEILIKDNLTDAAADKIVENYNNSCNDYDPYFYKKVADDYKLYKWEP